MSQISTYWPVVWLFIWNLWSPETETEEDDGIKPLSERLIIELTAHRTLALRDALANDPGAAFTAVLHALCLGAFYHTPRPLSFQHHNRARFGSYAQTTELSIIIAKLTT